MKRYLPIAIISAIISAAASAFNTTLLIDLFSATESLDKGLTLVVCIILFLFSAAAYLISSILAIVGCVLCKRSGNRRMTKVYMIEAILPVILGVTSYLLLFLAN